MEKSTKIITKIIKKPLPLKPEELECLIRWPSGCRGEESERQAIKSILSLMHENGGGRIKQIVDQICDIVEDRSLIADHQKAKNKWLKSMGFPVVEPETMEQK